MVPTSTAPSRLSRYGCPASAIAILYAVWLCSAAAASQPNIVLLFSDDAGYADFGFTSQRLGLATEFKTPNLDALANQSVYASKAYVTASICAVSRAGMLTGRYQQRFGFHWNALPTDVPNEGIPSSETLVFQHMKDLGYTTGVVGKWHVGQQPQWQPQNRGVDYFFGFLEGGDNYFYNSSANRIRRNTQLINWAAEPSFNNIPPDPTRGREMTDAFADEATKFIADYAGGSQPFFLYTSFYNPHSPYQAKSSDLSQFNGTSLTGERKTVAAMTYAMDRAVGLIMSRLQDPNGDGNVSDSILDNTIIVFANDNGGAVQGIYNNGPFAGLKGSAYEGGIRVPALIHAPGLSPGQYDSQISTLDFLPTFVTAAGGTPAANLDGVDLMPYLKGINAGKPHEYLYQHNRVNFSAVQDGEWKLVKPQATAYWRLYRLNPDGVGEDVEVTSQYPEKVAELTRAFVDFEVQTDKALNSTPTNLHFGNTFVFRNDVFVNAGWANSFGWINESGQQTGVSREDTTSSFIAVLRPNNNNNYSSIVNVTRAAAHAPGTIAAGHPDLPGLGETMMNELRLEGSFTGAVDRKATLTGNPLMLADNPQGRPAQIGLHALDASPNGSYLYELKNDMVLYNDLRLVGDGNVSFEINGGIRDFYTPRSVIKEGNSNIRLSGQNSFGGDLVIYQGRVEVSGATASIANGRDLLVASGGEYRQLGGDVKFSSVLAEPGASVQLLGGKFETNAIKGHFVNSGGNFAMASQAGLVVVEGNFTQLAGTLSMEIAGSGFDAAYDHLAVSGTMHAGGHLAVTLVDGFTPTANDAFWLFNVNSWSGQFSTVSMPALSAGLAWDASSLYTSGVVRVVQFGIAATDFNADLVIDKLDLEIWHANYGKSTSLGDADGSQFVDGSDFLAWQRTFSAVSHATAVPEPSARAILVLAMALAGVWGGAIHSFRIGCRVVAKARLRCGDAEGFESAFVDRAADRRLFTGAIGLRRSVADASF